MESYKWWINGALTCSVHQFTKYIDRINIFTIHWSRQNIGCKPKWRDRVNGAPVTEGVLCVLHVLLIYLLLSHFLLYHILPSPSYCHRHIVLEPVNHGLKVLGPWTTTTTQANKKLKFVACYILQWRDVTNTVNLQILALSIWQ